MFALFLQIVYAFETLLADFNVQSRIGMTDMGNIKHPSPPCKLVEAF